MLGRAARAVLPPPAIAWMRRVRETRFRKAADRELADKDPKYIFSLIYRNRWWGGSGFYSGHGSHDAAYVEPYIQAVSDFIATLSDRPSIVDLGCGDFNVGRRLAPLASRYVACDVVPELIDSHRVAFSEMGVDFRVLDITSDPLPHGDIGLLRQVLQHLSNAHILGVMERLDAFKFLIVAELVPHGDAPPNLDQPTGPYSRIARGVKSGVVLTAPPFNLRPVSERIISEVADDTGVLRTVLYQLR